MLHADQERVYSPRPCHREVLEIVPGKMERMHEHQNMRNNNLISRLSNFRNSERGRDLNFYLSKQKQKKTPEPVHALFPNKYA